MALNKQKINDLGITTNYHRVSHVILNDGNLNCAVDSYVSREYREQEKAADSQFFRFEITTEEEESMGIRALCYTKIKELPNWSDAEDC